MKELFRHVAAILNKKKKRTVWREVNLVLACVVVFITTYMLILPAITMQKRVACGIPEHQHSDECYERRLVCGLEEGAVPSEDIISDDSSDMDIVEDQGQAEGHVHTDDCYESVLVCGKEVHTHSAACYKKQDSSAENDTGAEALDPAEISDQNENEAGENETEDVSEESSENPGAVENTGDDNKSLTEEGLADGDTVEEPDMSGQSQTEDPLSAPVSLADHLTGETAVYYSRMEGASGEDVQESEGLYGGWNRLEKDTVLTPADKVRVYFAYQIPAGVLNESNNRAGYMLPAQLLLSSSRINEVNNYENGFAAGLQNNDEKTGFLGAEAVEGNRRPDEEQPDGTEEYISAIVNVENISDEEGKVSGQELIFKFLPYTVEKNSDVYDEEGVLTSKGEAVSGYFSLDYTVEEILSQEASAGSWYTDDSDSNAASVKDAMSVLKTRIIFAEKNAESGREEISEILNASVNGTEAGEQAVNTEEPEAEQSEDKKTETEKSGTEKSEVEKTETGKSEAGKSESEKSGEKASEEEIAEEVSEEESAEEESAEEDITVQRSAAVKAADSLAEGVWDLADSGNTHFLHVTTDSTVVENEQERNAAFSLTFTYSLVEDVVRAIDNYDKNPTLVYDMSGVLSISPLADFITNNTLGIISIGSRKLGTYKILDNKVYLEFTDHSYFDNRTSMSGWFKLTVTTDESQLGSADSWEYHFPGTSDSITIRYKKSVEEGKKSVYSTADSDGNYTLHYTADINVNSDQDSMTFYDTLSGLQVLDASSVKINGKSVNVSQTENGFSFDVASATGTTGIAKGAYQVTYNTKVTAAQLEEMTSDKTTEKNRASWKVNGNKDVPGGETTIEIKKPVPPIPVEKKITQGSGTSQPGDTITYTVKYGDADTSLSGFHISDYITDVVVPQGDSVTLQYGDGRTVDVPFGRQATDKNYNKGMVTLFDYTFPSDTQGSGPVTATYSVKLIDAGTAKENGVYDKTVADNIAQEHRQNTSDHKQTTVTYEKEPRYEVSKTASAKPTDKDGNWLPGSEITYTLTIGDENTNMAGINIKDIMTDLQVLQGDIMIKVGSGSPVKLADYVYDAVKWDDDGRYHSYDVDLFNFNMPSNAGKGPVVITYTTKVISKEQAAENNIYGDMAIRNTGYGGKQSGGTSGTGHFDPYPISKTVTKSNAEVNGKTVNIGSTLHYTLTFGDASMNLGGVTIFDEMTDLQKLVSDVTIKKADGTSVKMPMGTWQWAEDGVVWQHFDDGRYYVNQMVRVFNYRLPSDIGTGPITVEYDTQIISEEEANESGIKDKNSVSNRFTVNNHSAQTTVDVKFPTDPKHNPMISKEWDGFDIENNIVYWNITVEKDAESAYPIENITVAEILNDIHITEPSQKYYDNSGGRGFFGSDFDMVHAVVSTDDGTILTPGTEYTIDKENAKFNFPVLNERIHIRLAFMSPAKIVDGYKIRNNVKIERPYLAASAEAEYHNPNNIDIYKDGEYSEKTRLVKWMVVLNPSNALYPKEKKGDPVWFEDAVPKGLSIVNYNSHSTDNPTINVSYKSFDGRGHNIWLENVEKPVTVDENNVIHADVSHSGFWSDPSRYVGLNGEKIEISYYTLLSDEEWDRITSSASGSKTFENHATIKTGGGDKFEATERVTVTSEEYLTKTDTTQEKDGVVVGSISDPDLDGSASKNISFKIEINPHGYMINKGETLSLTDYISTNMDLDTASVRLYKAEAGADGKLVQGEEVSTKDIVSYNDDSRLLSLTGIPDRTPMILVYQATARSQGQDTYKNTATLIGGGSHSSSTNKTHTVQVNDAGVKVDGITVNLHKIDENNVTEDLENAGFQLYECRLAIGDLTNPDTYDQTYWEALLALVDKRTAGNASEEEKARIDKQFKIVGYDPVGEPVITRDKGFTQWPGLNEHKLYAWREVEAPDQYTGNTDYHYFVGYQHLDVNQEIPVLLSESEQLARKHAAWALDDACQFANDIRVASIANLTTWTATNIHTPYTSISVEKIWKGDSDNLFETRPKDGIKLQLVKISPDGTRTNVGSPVSLNVDDNGTWPVHIWNRLYLYDQNNPESNNTPYKYTVVESRVDGYSTTYSDNGEGQIIGTIKVTNKMIPRNTSINVKKVFSDPETEKPREIPITLIQIRTDKEGNQTRAEYQNTRLTESNDWKAAFTKLPTTMEDAEGRAYYLTYTVVEDTASLKDQGFDYDVSYSDNGEGVIEAPENDPLVITNKKSKGTIKVTKIFSGIKSLPEGFKITASYEIEGEKHSVELTTKSEGMTGDGSSDHPYTWEISDLPIGTEVTFVETGYETAGKTVTITGTGTAEDPATAKAVAAPDPAEAGFINTYDDAVIDLTLVKADAGDEEKRLTGAVFNIYRYDKVDSPAYDPEYSRENVEVDSHGELKLTGLKAGFYEVVETQIPAGYAKTTSDPWFKVIEENGLLTVTVLKGAETVLSYSAADNTLTVKNMRSAALPATGGPGTEIFTIIGCILVLGTGVLILRRWKTV